MKVLGSILILVIAMHSQCLNACPVELFLAAASAQGQPDSEPPCHHAQGSAPGPSHDSEEHKTNPCGFGLAVDLKSAAKLKSNFHVVSLDVPLSAEVESGFRINPPSA